MAQGGARQRQRRGRSTGRAGTWREQPRALSDWTATLDPDVRAALGHFEGARQSANRRTCASRGDDPIPASAGIVSLKSLIKLETVETTITANPPVFPPIGRGSNGVVRWARACPRGRTILNGNGGIVQLQTRGRANPTGRVSRQRRKANHYGLPGFRNKIIATQGATVAMPDPERGRRVGLRLGRAPRGRASLDASHEGTGRESVDAEREPDQNGPSKNRPHPTRKDEEQEHRWSRSYKEPEEV